MHTSRHPRIDVDEAGIARPLREGSEEIGPALGAIIPNTNGKFEDELSRPGTASLEQFILPTLHSEVRTSRRIPDNDPKRAFLIHAADLNSSTGRHKTRPDRRRDISTRRRPHRPTV